MKIDELHKDIKKMNPDIVICLIDNLDGTMEAQIAGKESCRAVARERITEFAINWLMNNSELEPF